MLFLFYLSLLPWTRYTPFPSLPVKIIWADLFFIPLCFKAAFFFWRLRKPAVFHFFEKSALLLLGILTIHVVFLYPSLRSFLKLAGMGYLFLILFVLKAFIHQERDLKQIFWIWFWISLGLSISGIVAYGVSQWQNQPNFFVLKDSAYLGGGKYLWRLWSIGYTPSMLAAYLHVGVVGALWLQAGEKDKKRPFFWFFSILFILAAILLGKSRMFLGVFVTLMVWEWYQWRSAQRLRRFFTILFSLFVFGCSVLVAGSVWCRITPILLDFEQNRIHISWNQEPSHYQFRNRLAFALWKEHPFIGAGLGKFQTYSQSCESIFAKQDPGFFQEIPSDWLKTPHDPHSTYQGALAETGMFGMSAIFVFLFSVVYSLWCSIRQSTDPITQRRMITFFAGIIGFLIHGFYLDILTLRYFWYLLGFISLYILFSKETIQEL